LTDYLHDKKKFVLSEQFCFIKSSSIILSVNVKFSEQVYIILDKCVLLTCSWNIMFLIKQLNV